VAGALLDAIGVVIRGPPTASGPASHTLVDMTTDGDEFRDHQAILGLGRTEVMRIPFKLVLTKPKSSEFLPLLGSYHLGRPTSKKWQSNYPDFSANTGVGLFFFLSARFLPFPLSPLTHEMNIDSNL